MTAPPIVLDPVSDRVQSFLAAAQEFGVLAEDGAVDGRRYADAYVESGPGTRVYFDADGITRCAGLGTGFSSGILVLSFVLALH